MVGFRGQLTFSGCGVREEEIYTLCLPATHGRRHMFGAWSSETSLPRTWWWGERGLVGALFHDLSAGDELNRWTQFVNQIKFGSGSRSWGLLKNVHVVVEPSFGNRGFGRPDAVALLEFDVQGRVAIFFEAKRGPYAEAAKSPVGRAMKGFNSTINGQLELNHRLALALARWNSPDVLEESQWILDTPYGASNIRRVKDRDVLDRLLKPLGRLQDASYLHAILTLDSKNPFDDPEMGTYMPEIFLSGSAADQWQTERKRFGWVGWSRIVELIGEWSKRGEPSLFLDTWRFFGLKLTEEDPAVSEQPMVAPSGWTATRPVQGVALIFAPQINSRTYLHFSWKQEGCALRDYSHSDTDMPKTDRSRRTQHVLPLIRDEFPTTAQRPKYSDVQSWHQRVTDVNRSHGLQVANNQRDRTSARRHHP